MTIGINELNNMQPEELHALLPDAQYSWSVEFTISYIGENGAEFTSKGESIIGALRQLIGMLDEKGLIDKNDGKRS